MGVARFRAARLERAMRQQRLLFDSEVQYRRVEESEIGRRKQPAGVRALLLRFESRNDA